MRKFLLIGVAAVAVAAPLSAPAAVANTAWGGSWDTKSTSCLYKLNLRQTGNTVKGNAGYYAAQMKGTVKGNKLVGTWSKAVGAPWKTGSFVFVISSNHKTFSGWIKPTGKAKHSCQYARGLA